MKNIFILMLSLTACGKLDPKNKTGCSKDADCIEASSRCVDLVCTVAEVDGETEQTQTQACAVDSECGSDSLCNGTVCEKFTVIERASFTTELAKTLCTGMQTACGIYYDGSNNLSDCTSNAMSLINVTAFGTQVESATYDARQAAMCLRDQLQAFGKPLLVRGGSFTSGGAYALSCNGVFTGNIATNEGCYNGQLRCGKNAFCTYGLSTTTGNDVLDFICISRTGKLGDTCVSETGALLQDCEPGLYCSYSKGGTCEQRRGIGSSCERSRAYVGTGTVAGVPLNMCAGGSFCVGDDNPICSVHVPPLCPQTAPQ